MKFKRFDFFAFLLGSLLINSAFAAEDFCEKVLGKSPYREVEVESKKLWANAKQFHLLYLENHATGEKTIVKEILPDSSQEIVAPESKAIYHTERLKPQPAPTKIVKIEEKKTEEKDEEASVSLKPGFFSKVKGFFSGKKQEVAQKNPKEIEKPVLVLSEPEVLTQEEPTTIEKRETIDHPTPLSLKQYIVVGSISKKASKNTPAEVLVISESELSKNYKVTKIANSASIPAGLSFDEMVFSNSDYKYNKAIAPETLSFEILIGAYLKNAVVESNWFSEMNTSDVRQFLLKSNLQAAMLIKPKFIDLSIGGESAELKGINLERAQLAGVEIENAYFNEGNFKGLFVAPETSLEFVSYVDPSEQNTETSFKNVVFEKSSFLNANLSLNTASKLYFIESHLSKMKLDSRSTVQIGFKSVVANEMILSSRQVMDRVSILKSNFSESNLYGFYKSADFNSSQFVKASFGSAGFTDAKIQDCSFMKASFYTHDRGALFEGKTSVSKSSFREADLRKVQFKNADLQEVDFSLANLERADFNETSLVGINFSSANLRNAKFSGTQDKVNFDGADLRGAHLLEGIFDSNSYQNARIDRNTVILRRGVQREKVEAAKWPLIASFALESHRPLNEQEMMELAKKHGMFFDSINP